MKSKDLTNQKIGKLTVLYRIEDKIYHVKNGRKTIVPQWYCKCECGNECTRTEISLIQGLTKSCGCTKTYNTKDYSGQKFNYLTVLYKTDPIIRKGKKITVYHCRCDCGNECDITSSHIKTTKSCGCGLGKIKDLKGQRFGKLLVIDRAPDHIYSSGIPVVAWNCICDCGVKCVKTSHSLVSGKTTSCGCKFIESQFKKADNHFDITSKSYGIGYCNNGKRKFYFDLEDFDKIKQYSWSIDCKGYVYTVNIDEHKLLLKNLIMNVSQTDKNIAVNFVQTNNRHDNRKINLWVCTRNQCHWGANRKAINSTGIIGVWYNKVKKTYTAGLTENGNLHLYETTNLEKAIEVRKQWEEKYFGKYSYDNRQAINLNKEGI